MNCLVVIAHPLEKSLCAHLAAHVVSQLMQQGHEVVVEDLYREGFEPRLSSRERASYYDEVYSRSGIEDEASRLLAAEAIVLVYPTWWFGFPAVLKGWVDRV